ncbi:hypothetical protein [Thermopirellula anaerolimosa]
MPIAVFEKWESRQTTEGESPSVDLIYIVRGTDNDLSAKSALAAASPVLYDGLVRQSLHIERVAADIWEGSVRYGKLQPPETGDSSYQFDTGGGTQHITQSLQTVGRYAPSGKTAPDFQGAIGVTHDNVEGVDIAVPVFNFSETHYIASPLVTSAYKATLFSLTGKVNGGTFRGFAPGEVLFLGASGSQRGQEDWEITFRFAASPNVTGLVIGNIAGISKKGWEYLWVRYADDEDAAAKALVKRPIAAYVEQVYPYGDFSGLGIGA